MRICPPLRSGVDANWRWMDKPQPQERLPSRQSDPHPPPPHATDQGPQLSCPIQSPHGLKEKPSYPNAEAITAERRGHGRSRGQHGRKSKLTWPKIEAAMAEIHIHSPPISEFLGKYAFLEFRCFELLKDAHWGCPPQKRTHICLHKF